MKNKRLLCTTVATSAMLLGLGACTKTVDPVELTVQAQQYQQRGDHKAAVIQLKNALQQNPDNIEARRLLASVYLDIDEPASAEKEIRKAASLGLNSAAALPILSSALFEQGKVQEVIDATSEATDAETLAARGGAFLAQVKRDEAQAAFERALAAKPDLPAALIGFARLALGRKDVAEANRYAGLAVEKNPTSVDAWVFQGDLAGGQGKTEAALAAYAKALALRPAHIQARLQRAQLYMSERKFDQAKEEIAGARKIAPGNLQIDYTEALLEFGQGHYPVALTALQKVLGRAPEYMPAVVLAGAVQLALGSLPQAEQHLRKYLANVPGNNYARKLLATTLISAQQPKEALEVLRPVLKDSQDVQVLTLAGKAHMAQLEFAKATQLFETAAAIEPQQAAVRTALGLSRLSQGQRERGLEELETAVRLDGKSREAGLVLAMTALRLKDYDKALTTLQAMEKNGPDNPVLHNLKGDAYLGKNDLAAARASYERGLALQAAYFPAAYSLAQLDLREKRPAAAKQRLQEFQKRHPADVDAMNVLAVMAAREDDAAQATMWLEKVRAARPNEVQPAIHLGGQYLRTGQFKNALNLIRAVQVEHPRDPDVLDMLAQTQLANQDNTGALATYHKLASVAPKRPEPQLRIAAVQVMLKNDALAEEAVKKALALSPDYLQAQLLQGQIAMRRGRVESALATARQIQQRTDGAAAAGHELEGDLYVAQGKPAQALPAFERALRISQAGAHVVKIHNQMRLAGQGKEADARLVQWLKEHPDDSQVAMYLAEAYLASGQNKPAIALLQDILKKQPKNAAAHNNLAWAYHQEKDKRALDSAEQALSLAGENPLVIDTAGWILVEQGNTARGIALLQKAYAMAPNAPEIRYHLAVGLRQGGQQAESRKHLEQLLASGKKFPQIEAARALLRQE